MVATIKPQTKLAVLAELAERTGLSSSTVQMWEGACPRLRLSQLICSWSTVIGGKPLIHLLTLQAFSAQRRLLTSAGTSSPAMRLRNNAVRASNTVVTGTVIDSRIGISQPCSTGPDLSTEK